LELREGRANRLGEHIGVQGAREHVQHRGVERVLSDLEPVPARLDAPFVIAEAPVERSPLAPV
jgi:hypothetical protein